MSDEYSEPSPQDSVQIQIPPPRPSRTPPLQNPPPRPSRSPPPPQNPPPPPPPSRSPPPPQNPPPPPPSTRVTPPPPQNPPPPPPPQNPKPKAIKIPPPVPPRNPLAQLSPRNHQPSLQELFPISPPIPLLNLAPPELSSPTVSDLPLPPRFSTSKLPPLSHIPELPQFPPPPLILSDLPSQMQMQAQISPRQMQAQISPRQMQAQISPRQMQAQISPRTYTQMASADIDDPKIDSLRNLTYTNFATVVTALEKVCRSLQSVYSLKAAIELSKQILAYKRALESACESFLSVQWDGVKNFLEENPRPTANQFAYSPQPTCHFSSAESHAHVSALLTKTAIVLGQALDIMHFLATRLGSTSHVTEVLTLAKCARWIKNNAQLGLSEELVGRLRKGLSEQNMTIDVDLSLVPAGGSTAYYDG